MTNHPAPSRTDTRPDDAELIVLSILAEERLYGYAIAKKVAARSGGDLRLTPGLLYPLLARLEKSGLVTASWDEVRSDRREPGDAAESSEEPGGRRRKWYRLSSKGQRRLEQRIGAHLAYTRLIARFLSTPGEENE